MNYLKIYNTIIFRGLTRIKQKRDGLHKHRIIPGFERGKYIEGNITLLTRQEHRIIHKIRYKLYNKIEDKISFTWLSGSLTDEVVEYLKSQGSIKGGINSNNKNKLLKTGIYALTKEERISAGKKGAAKIKELGLGIYNLTPEQKEKAGINSSKSKKIKFKKDLEYREKIISIGKKNIEKIPLEKKIQGGKTCGKINAESGHCKNIAHLGGLKQGPKNKKFLQELSKKKSKKVKVGEVIYNSQTEAGKYFGIVAASVRDRILSKNFTDWNYVE